MKKLTGKTIISERQLQVPIDKEMENHNKEIENKISPKEILDEELPKIDSNPSIKNYSSLEDFFEKENPQITPNPSIKSDHMYQELILPTSVSQQNVIDKLNNTGYMFIEEGKKPIEDSINTIIANSPIDTSLISDGKKTFGQLYNRIQELLDERDGK